MQKGLLTGLTPRIAVLAIILLSNAFVWYYCADEILLNIAPTTAEDSLARIQIIACSFAGLIGAALVGAKISRRIANKERFLSIWMVFGILMPFAAILAPSYNVYSAILLALGFGISLGIGLPSCMEYFSRSNPTETRGRLAGLTMLATGISILALESFGSTSLYSQVISLSGWRMFGLLAFVALKPRLAFSFENKTPSYGSIIVKRSFLLYFAPWIMLSLLNYLSTPALNDIAAQVVSEEMRNLMPMVQNFTMAITAVIAGFVADIVGRKPVAITGFVSLGLGYAALGFIPQDWLVLGLLFHTFVNGIAWGALIVIFVITIWGEISRNSASEKFYALGVAPFFVSRFLSFALEARSTVLPDLGLSSIFSLSAFFLFLAVLPLVYADETLPEKIKKTRELRIYVQKAQEIAQKYY